MDQLARFFVNPLSRRFLRGLRHLMRVVQACFRLRGQAKSCDTVIAVDNFLYIVCCTLFPHKRVILWSHDFISYDQQRKTALLQPTIARKTRHFLTQRREILIQDAERLRVLLESLGYTGPAEAIRCFYLPVSLPDAQPSRKTFCTAPLVMQIGGIRPAAMSHKLLEQYQLPNTKFELYFHGFISEEIVEQVNGCSRVPLLSATRLAADKLPALIARADIGFIYYEGADDLNYFHIRNASCQLVEFLRLGKPMVGMGNTNLQELFAEYKIGHYIHDIADMDTAVETITAHYDAYARNARALFSSHYDLHLYMPPFIAWLSR